MGTHAVTRRLQSRGEESRRDILNAAIRLLGRSGIGAITMRKVGTEAGISDGSIMFHYGSRAGLMKAVVDELRNRGRGFVRSTLLSPPASGRDLAIGIVDAILDWARSDLESLRAANVMMAETAARDLVEMRTGRLEGVRLVAAALQKAMDRGELKRLRPESFVEFVVGAVQGAQLRADAAGTASDPEPLFEIVRAAALAVLGVEDDAALVRFSDTAGVASDRNYVEGRVPSVGETPGAFALSLLP